MKRKDILGSITLEAALMVPMFIILMLLVNGFFVMFMGQQIMAHTLVQSAKSLAYDPYSPQRVSAEEENELADMFVDIFSFVGGDYVSSLQWYDGSYPDLEGIVEERYIAYLDDSRTEANELLESIGVQNGIGGLDFSGCSVEDDVLTVKLKYTQEFVLDAAGLTAFERELSVKVKLFMYDEL